MLPSHCLACVQKRICCACTSTCLVSWLPCRCRARLLLGPGPGTLLGALTEVHDQLLLLLLRNIKSAPPAPLAASTHLVSPAALHVADV